ncbi:hypothetical protein PsorP6_015473 [Peronosclerospora sorghi]|uniref:Uncharacterized protein n=1 Tax=Peronosclerospora sorghi TaxID=230839 RepID=A0ACC0WR46_9STRA|nr:hypothetical protein PsorP6_015473 [Peronosclerospora sorghi]
MEQVALHVPEHHVVSEGNHATASFLYRMDWVYRFAKMLLDEADHMSRLEYCGQIKIRRSRCFFLLRPSCVCGLQDVEMRSRGVLPSPYKRDQQLSSRSRHSLLRCRRSLDMRTISVKEPFVIVNNLPVPLTYRVRSAFSSAYGSGTRDSPSEPETIAVGAKTSIWWTDIVQRLYSN